MVREQRCQRALTQKRTLYRAAAYRRVVIFVSLRMAASAEAPSSPIWLSLILHSEGWDGIGERVGLSTGTDTKANTLGLWLTPGW